MQTICNCNLKRKTPRRFFAWSGGVLIPDEPSEEGVRLSRTGNWNLTTWTEETKTPPAKKDDSRGECFRLKRQVSTKGYHRPDYSNEGVGPLTPTIKLNNVSRRNKKPAPAGASAGFKSRAPEPLKHKWPRPRPRHFGRYFPRRSWKRLHIQNSQKTWPTDALCGLFSEAVTPDAAYSVG